MIPRMSKKTESSGQALNHQQFGYEQLKQVADLQYVQMFFLFCTCRVWSSCGSKTFRLHNSCSSTDASSDLILKTEDAFQWSSTVYFVFRFFLSTSSGCTLSALSPKMDWHIASGTIDERSWWRTTENK